MNSLPISLAELVERLVPGLALLVLLLLTQLDVNNVSFEGPVTLGILLAMLVSYLLGVLTNIISNLLEDILFDRYFLNKSDSRYKSVNLAFVKTFGHDADETSWQLCYGVAHKHGYLVSTTLFRNLYVFCGSMSVVSVISAILLCFSNMNYRYYYVGLYIVCALLFARGSRVYSRAFISSIYDGFVSWDATRSNDHP